ncbi:dynein light chain LC6, flagellar outer arm-like [Pyrus x bretschneideri]|uniref:dynein light chain LC6, flagellar outer arm-like n=1 Tax=Pyrus x bretschneideri TaxID=225117 RepID=UPI00202F4035|nr:dynein light chain LC6, flagellar outer arm-like [Pyrus x bretschneideri]
MLEGKAVIVETDMLQTMQQKALDLTSKVLDLFDVTEATEIGRFIKKEFDRTYGPGWQCIVGADFGSFVTHCHGCFIYFCVGSLAVLMFRGAAGPEAEAKQPCAAALEAIQAGSSYSLHHFVL